MNISDVCTYGKKSQIKAGDATQNGDYVFFTSSPDENKRYSSYQFDCEAIILGTGGNATLHYKKGKFSVSTDCIVLMPQDILRTKYLYWFFCAHMEILEKGFKGAGLKHISKEYINAIDLPMIPSQAEQDRVIATLDKVSEGIAVCRQMLADLDVMVKARFVEMFGDPETNPKGFTKAPMGNYMTVLTDFSSNGSYKTLDSGVTMYDEPNYAWMVRTTDLESGDMSSIKYIDEQAYMLLAKSKIFGGEIIMNKIGSAGKVYLMPQIEMPASLGRNAFMFRYDHRINVKFLYHLLVSEYGQREIQQYVRGAVTKTITKNDARAVLIIVPEIELQDAFVAFCEQVDKSKDVVQQQLAELETLKKSLMQEYFG